MNDYRVTGVRFEGFTGRRCGDHRTVGAHRAWCFDCHEWCYPSEPCAGCVRNPVPDDLAAWFDGRTVLAERHGMPRIQPRWRVVEVLALLGDDDEPWVAKGEWREFKTEHAATRYRDNLAANGATVLIQPGFTFWPDPSEWPSGP